MLGDYFELWFIFYLFGVVAFAIGVTLMFLTKAKLKVVKAYLDQAKSFCCEFDDFFGTYDISKTNEADVKHWEELSQKIKGSHKVKVFYDTFLV